MKQLPDEDVEALHHAGQLQFQLISCSIVLYLEAEVSRAGRLTVHRIITCSLP